MLKKEMNKNNKKSIIQFFYIFLDYLNEDYIL